MKTFLKVIESIALVVVGFIIGFFVEKEHFTKRNKSIFSYPAYRYLSKNYQLKNIIFPSIDDAFKILNEMLNIIEDYGSVSYCDYYELCGEESTFEDTKVGWFNINDANVKEVAGGYSIVFPAPEYLI